MGRAHQSTTYIKIDWAVFSGLWAELTPNLMAQLLCNLIRGQYVLNAQPAFMPKDIYIFSDGPKYAP